MASFGSALGALLGSVSSIRTEILALSPLLTYSEHHLTAWHGSKDQYLK